MGVTSRDREYVCQNCGSTIGRTQRANRRHGGLVHGYASDCAQRAEPEATEELRATDRQVSYAADLARQNPGVLGLDLGESLEPTLRTWRRSEVSRAIDLLLESR